MSHKSDVMDVIRKIMEQKRCPVCGIPSEDDEVLLSCALEALETAFGRVMSDDDTEQRLAAHERRIRGSEQIIEDTVIPECIVWVAVTVPEYNDIVAGKTQMICKDKNGGTKMWNMFHRKVVTHVRINRYYTNAYTDRVFLRLVRGPGMIKGKLVDDCVRVHFSTGEV